MAHYTAKILKIDIICILKRSYNPRLTTLDEVAHHIQALKYLHRHEIGPWGEPKEQRFKALQMYHLLDPEHARRG
jgi:hypothetical protein